MKKIFTTLLHVLLITPLITAQITFEQITDFAFNDNESYLRGISWVDVDNDFDLDVCISGSSGIPPNTVNKTQIFLNNNDGTFTPSDLLSTNQQGTMSHGWADIENDGDLDIYLAATWNFGGLNELWSNNGDGTGFTEVAFSGATSSQPSPYEGSVSWGDFDNDGAIDLFLPRWNLQTNFLYKNNGNGTFSSLNLGELNTDGNWTSGGIWGDYDNDGDLDLYVYDYQNGAGSGAQNSLFENNGDGTFTKNLTAGDVVDAGQNTRTANWVDANNDGYLDIYVTNQGSNDKLHLNNGDGTFSTLVTPESGGTSWASNWGDVDNDGDQDLFTIGFGGNDTGLYLNDGNGILTKANADFPSIFPLPTSGSMSNAAMLTDYDNDGWLDLHIVQPNTIEDRLYRNIGDPCIAWFKAKLTGTESNWAAIGTKVRALANINGQDVWQLQQVSAQTSKTGQNPMWVNFGFGDASIIDSLVIEWPSGAVCSYGDVAVNQFVEIVEDCSVNEIIAPIEITGESSLVTLCIGDDDIQLEVPSGNTTGAWSASCGNCVNGAGIFAASTLDTGTYQAYYTEGGICGFRDTVNIVIEDNPTLTISNDTTVIEGSLVELLVSGAQSYTWSPAGILSCDDCEMPSFLAQETTTFSVTGTSMFGCIGTADVTVTVETIPTFEMPNVFSPNNDNHNDFYGPVFLGNIFESFHMKIYSRWGELVYESTNPLLPWDGTYKGENSPSDVYIYSIDYNLTNNDSGIKQGEITLLR